MTYRWIIDAHIPEYSVDPTDTQGHPHGALNARINRWLTLEYVDADGYGVPFGAVMQAMDEDDDGQPIPGTEYFWITVEIPFSKEEDDGIDVSDIETGMNMLTAMYHARINPQ